MNKEELTKQMQKHAEDNGIQLNPDEDTTNRIIGLLARNAEEKGKAYCPCRVLSGDAKKDDMIVCPCVYHMGEIELQGRCHCNLFWKK